MWQQAHSWLRSWLQPNLWRAGRDYWLAQTAGWGLLWMVNVIASSSAYRQFLPWAALEIFLCLAVALLLTHGMRAVIRRGHWLELPPARMVLRMAGFILLAALVMTAFNEGLDHVAPEDAAVLLRRQTHQFWAPGLWVAQMAQFCVTAGFWTILYVGQHQRQRQRARELEFWQLRAALADAELQALRAQVNPHFLFNCLNSLRALVVLDPARAQDAVTQLAGLLRYALQSGSQRTVPLAVEWRMVENYVALEVMRFEESMQFQMEADPETLIRPVPPMAVQILVENAIKHGANGRPPVAGAPDTVTVRSRLDPVDGSLLVEVVNSGTLTVPADPPVASAIGLGLVNVRERLRRLFGPSATLDLREETPGRVTARLCVPRPTTESIPSVEEPSLPSENPGGSPVTADPGTLISIPLAGSPGA